MTAPNLASIHFWLNRDHDSVIATSIAPLERDVHCEMIGCGTN